MRKVSGIQPGFKTGNRTVIKRVEAPDHIKNKNHSFWECLCTCGSTTIVAGHHLKHNTTKGCRACAMVYSRKERGECSFNGLYLRYQHNAATRNLQFELSKEEFRTLTKQNCHYCNQEPNGIHKGKTAHGEYLYNGVDRKDHKLSYTVDNCVSSCTLCNFAKHKLGYNEFLNWVDKIATYRNTQHVK